MTQIKKNERTGIIVNVAACLITLLVSEYATSLLSIGRTSRHYVMPSWGEIFAVALTPLLLAGVFGFAVPLLLKWNKQPHGRLVTFLTVLWSYLAFELFRIIAVAIQTLSGTHFLPVLLWVPVILVIITVAISVWKLFYVWQRHHVRSVVIVFAAIAMPFYILLPLLETYVARLTFFIHFYS